MRQCARALLRLGICATAMNVALCGSVWAQATNEGAGQNAAPSAANASPAAGREDSTEAIVVTGTRITGGFAAPSPVTVLTNERTQSLAITNVGDALNQLPAFRPSVGPNTQANNGGNIGARLLDLRGLNPQRTLVLVDGHRFVPSTPTGSVDINLIPSSLVQRTDIVTGGASAAYGSDAVAGVVNFMLDRRLKGIKAEVQSGISQRGDNASQYVSLAGGFDIGSRIHVVLAGEYENNEGLGDCNTRVWCRDVNSIVANPTVGTNAYNGGPSNYIVLGGARVATMSPAGVINTSLNAQGRPIYPSVVDSQGGVLRGADPLRGLTFNNDGSTRPFQYGQLVGSLYMVGGEGDLRNPFIVPYLLTPPVRRYVGYGSVEAELTDTITGTVDVSYGRVEGHVIANVFRDFNGSLTGTIKSGNPFIPDSVQQTMTQNNIAAFILGRAGFDIGAPTADSVTETYRGVLGLKGSLGSRWKWDIAYEYGQTDFRQDGANVVNVQHMANAVDAVRNVQGNIVCRINAVSITDAACAPINLFGENRFSPEARAYVTGSSFQTTRNTQHDVAANVSGSLFDLPAGPFSIAVGAEYRRDSISGDADDVSKTNGYFQLNGSAIESGHVDVKEVYGEAELPILKDFVIAHSLSLNGAIRRTDYSTSGAVTTWKIGGVYEPIRAVRLRVTQSRDIRAPNLQELRGPTIKTTATLIDPARPGQNVNPTVLTGSNPNLTPEKADSFTAGIVLTPTGGFARRMRLSVDYYDIEVNNVISTLGAQSVVTGCTNGDQTLCALIERDPISGIVSQVRDIVLNSKTMQTRGFDIEYQYRQPLGNLGDLNFQLLANIALKLLTADGVDRSGQTGWRATTIPGAPDYTLDGLLGWSRGKVSLTGHAHYIPKGIYSVNFIDSTQQVPQGVTVQTVNNNQLPSRFYFDLAGNVKIPVNGKDQMEVFGSINNLFDQDPPPTPSITGGTNQILFDPIGRTFKVGVRVRFGGK